MPLILSASTSASSREPIPADTYVARCVEIIELGHVAKNFDGKASEKHEIRITWELPHQMQEYDGRQEPARIGEDYTFTMDEKGNLRKLLKNWRGRDFNEQEMAGFEIDAILGAPCMLTVVHRAKGDKSYANVGGVAKLMKGMECPPQVNPSKLLTYGDFDYAYFDKLPDFIKKKMQATPEYRKLTAPATPAPAAKAPAPQLASGSAADDDNDLPF